MASVTASPISAQTSLRESLKAYQEEKSKLERSSGVFSKIKESFATGTPLLPFSHNPAAAGAGPLANSPTLGLGSILGSSSAAANTGSGARWNLFSTTQEPSWFEHFGLSLPQRWMMCGVFILLGAIFFSITLMRMFYVVLSPAKFAFPYCFSSLFFITSYGFVKGMKTHLKSFFTKEKIYFSGMYLILTVTTLIFAFYEVSFIFMLPMVLLQFMSFVWYLVSFVPGGTSGFSTVSKVAVSSFVSRF